MSPLFWKTQRNPQFLMLPGVFLYQTSTFPLKWAWTWLFSHSLFTLLIPSQVQKGKPSSLHFIYMDESRVGFDTALLGPWIISWWFFSIHVDSSLLKGISWVRFIWRRGKPGRLWVSFESPLFFSKTRLRCLYVLFPKGIKPYGSDLLKRLCLHR